MRPYPGFLVPLPAVFLFVAATWSVWATARKVVTGQLQGIDQRLLHAMRDPAEPQSPIGPLWVEHVARDITALGSMTVIILLTATMSGFFFLVRRRKDSMLVAGAIATGMGAFVVLKHFVARPRPQLVSPLVFSETHSFPSGHVMLAVVLYFTGAILLSRHIALFRIRAFVWTAAIVLTLAIALSRTYLGIHWPSDVFAGYLAGISWTALWWLVFWSLRTFRPVPLRTIAANGLQQGAVHAHAGGQEGDVLLRIGVRAERDQ